MAQLDISSLNISSKSTQSPCVDQQEYGSNVSQGKNQQSSTVITPIKQPGMIQPSPDSCQLIGQQQNPTNTNPCRKQKNHPTDSEKKTITPIVSQSTNNITKYQVINVAQDSDEENSTAKNTQQYGNPEFDHIKDYFSEPFCRKDDVSHTINNIYM
ncbi:hypothetical protein VP01_77g7 [Puccinia sorghi]|uniref:Uncharacterized protein n=1 Tax=Puccinia sorghi TaxID=27349 RepID=A0A0L6UB67_9BASI|nr:hypothetical protein VP01_77g7 [Puccinia sorghi]